MTIQAESYSGSKGTSAGTGTVVGHIDSEDWLSYDIVDFGTDKTKFIASIGMDPSYATIDKRLELRLDSPTGTTIGAFTINSTGGWIHMLHKLLAYQVLQEYINCISFQK
ncbi:carbohydrate-binding protein [Bacillus sp. NPDC094077]|uniref:carbohydrate-binding protein n=1 Tax=Bacillus sp. NPDC094077 TaxID=3390932 RepID=UPI003CFEA37E